METTTLTELEEMNAAHCREHGSLSSSHMEKVEAIRALIEPTDHAEPRPGDFVVLHGRNRDGDVTYNNAHLEHVHYDEDSDLLSACTQPYEPFVSAEGWIQASGGYWLSVKKSDLKWVETRKKRFWTWRDRPCGNGGIRFFVTVNVWEYTDLERIY